MSFLMEDHEQTPSLNENIKWVHSDLYNLHCEPVISKTICDTNLAGNSQTYTGLCSNAPRWEPNTADQNHKIQELAVDTIKLPISKCEQQWLQKSKRRFSSPSNLLPTVSNSEVAKSIIVQLNIETITDHIGPYLFEVHPKMTVQLLMLQVEKELCVPLSVQRWIINDTFVSDIERSLSSYSVSAGSSLFLYINLNNEKYFDLKRIARLLNEKSEHHRYSSACFYENFGSLDLSHDIGFSTHYPEPESECFYSRTMDPNLRLYLMKQQNSNVLRKNKCTRRKSDISLASPLAFINQNRNCKTQFGASSTKNSKRLSLQHDGVALKSENTSTFSVVDMCDDKKVVNEIYKIESGDSNDISNEKCPKSQVVDAEANCPENLDNGVLLANDSFDQDFISEKPALSRKNSILKKLNLKFKRETKSSDFEIAEANKNITLSESISVTNDFSDEYITHNIMSCNENALSKPVLENDSIHFNYNESVPRDFKGGLDNEIVLVTYDLDNSRFTSEEDSAKPEYKYYDEEESQETNKEAKDFSNPQIVTSISETESTKNFEQLMETDKLNLVLNSDAFQCSICLEEIAIGQGVTLHECLHTFCLKCLVQLIDHADDASIKCPYRDDTYSCECHLQHREVKALVSASVYEQYLKRSLITAESLAERSFHCQTPNCSGWCVLEENVNIFHCPVCSHFNCLNCRAIHERLNCRQYQDTLKEKKNLDKDSEKTLQFLSEMIDDGKAMKCPKCDLILMKKWGCDWLKCGICKTEICWITKGPRWGPAGQGDVSAGCRCGVNGIKCHPSCTYCH